MEKSNTNRIAVIALIVWIVLISGCTKTEQVMPSPTNATTQQPSITTQPTSSQNQTSTSSEVSKELEDAIGKQTIIFSHLSSIGINDSLIDITKERVLVRYNLPGHLEKEKTYYFAIGISAKVSPESDTIQIQTYKDFSFLEAVSVKMNDIMDFLNNKTSFEEFKKKISYTTS